jgi:hypothetical protein
MTDVSLPALSLVVRRDGQNVKKKDARMILENEKRKKSFVGEESSAVGMHENVNEARKEDDAESTKKINERDI